MSSVSPRLRLGTRGSPLALIQAREVQKQLAASHAWPEDDVEIIVIRTSGDAIQDRPLSQAGGKGLFTKELDISLLDRHIDLAVHAAKDLPTLMPTGIVIAGYLAREDARDAFIARGATSPRDLPPAAVVGSASLRREAQLRRLRPDLVIRLLRGNVETRLKKVADGEFAATVLAVAGLKRLGLADSATAILDMADFLPAVGQGAIAITTRVQDELVREAVAPILDEPTARALLAERSFLAVLDGSCRTPIAGHASSDANQLNLRGMVLQPDGSQWREVVRIAEPSEAARLGREAGQELLAQLPSGFLHR
jgi:hydroxymethylbilane synthase